MWSRLWVVSELFFLYKAFVTLTRRAAAKCRVVNGVRIITGLSPIMGQVQVKYLCDLGVGYLSTSLIACL